MSPNVEQWLAEIAENTARQAELLERRQANEEQNRRREDSYIEKLGKRIEQGVTSQLSYRLNQAQSIANRGFSGTVEQARMDYAMEQLARQFAGVMKPVMDALTYGAAQIELRMRMMGGSEQNRLLGMGMGGLAGFAAARMFGGPAAALALGGIAAGGALMSPGYNSTDSTLGSVGGAYAGFKIGSRFGPMGAAIGTGVGAIAGNATLSGDYEMLKKMGASRPVAGLAAIGYTVMDALGIGQDRMTEQRKAYNESLRSGADTRRAVTPYQADMLEAGGSYFAMQKGVIRASTGAGFEEDNFLKPIIDAILMVVDAIAGTKGETVLRATSATEAARPSY